MSVLAPRAIADTSVLIASQVRAEPHSAWAARVLFDFGTIAVTPIVLGELATGAELHTDPAKRRLRRQMFEEAATLLCFPIGAATAIEYAILNAAARAQGRSRARMNDLWLAASAREHRLPILTCNPDDFADLPGVRTIGPETPPEAFA